jgi:excisionase family DNA binding protein
LLVSTERSPSPDIFGIREAAAFLGVHEQTVRRLSRRGAIPCFKVGRDWRFRKEALLRWSEEHHERSAKSRAGETGACSVLVIDDEEKVCRALAGMLQRIGCRVRTATRGRDGLALVREEPPDLILLDLKMPDMNGPQLLAELRAEHPHLPVVIVTGYPDGRLMLEASQHAPLMMLAKPVEKELLERTVRVAIGAKAAVAAVGGER